MADPSPPPDPDDDLSGETGRGQITGTPRWVKVSAIVAAVLLALAVVVMVASGGHHGPGRHLSPGGLGDQAPSGSVEDRGTTGGSGAPPLGGEP